MASRTRRTLLIGSMLLSAFQSSARYQTESKANTLPAIFSGPVPEEDLDHLVETADLIVLGEVITAERTGASETGESGKPVNVFVYRLTLRIDETLRGDQDSPLVFDTISRWEGAWRQPVYGLFFFRVGEDKKITFSDPYYSVISTPRDLHSHGETALDRVVSILGDMLMRPNGRTNGALPHLRSSKSKAANGVLRAALNTVADPQLSLQVANALLLQGDRFALGFIKQNFLTGPKIPMEDLQEQVFGNVMTYYLKDPEAISDLEELLGSPSVSIRRGAAGALGRTKSPQAVHGLARALEDADSTVRFWGVVGLFAVSGQTEGRPGEEFFKANESRYLTYWKEWARNR